MTVAPPADLEIRQALIFGLGVTGRSVALALRGRDVDVVLADDRPGGEMREFATQAGTTLLEAPDLDRLSAAVADADVVLPSPGVPAGHDIYRLAAQLRTPVISEFDLAARYDRRPVAAITGTNGKTTVTMLTALMLERSDVRAVVAGNTDVPLVAAIDDADAEVFVVEASSFRLEQSQWFAPQVATWLNLAPDHLDWHPSHEAYGAAKARIWRNQRAGDVAVVNADDEQVMRYAAGAPAEVQTFSTAEGVAADFTVDRAAHALVGPAGELIEISALPRALPHDLANALAASATALAAGATLKGVRVALREFSGLPHRVVDVAELSGVRFVNDSKATAPHATVAAVRGFSSVVLIAGGRNKGLDLAELRVVADRLRGVVAIGDAAGEVVQAFEGLVPSQIATSMDEAVRYAAAMAEPGDVVLLSPACASFDWYGGYAERGADFEASVRALTGADGGETRR